MVDFVDVIYTVKSDALRIGLMEQMELPREGDLVLGLVVYGISLTSIRILVMGMPAMIVEFPECQRHYVPVLINMRRLGLQSIRLECCGANCSVDVHYRLFNCADVRRSISPSKSDSEEPQQPQQPQQTQQHTPHSIAWYMSILPD